MDKPDVFMPLFIGDYLAGTSRLTTELHGAYMLLIMDYWMNGAPPDNDQILASIVKMSPDAWSSARAVLVHFFSIDQGCWKHKRIEHELAEATIKKQNSKNKAEKAAAARWADHKKNAPSNPQAKHDECPSPSPSPSQKEKTKNSLSAKKFTDEDFGIANEFWEMLLAENPENKKPNLNSWADDIRLMRERDNRTPHQIRWLWHWARGDPFWSTNIRAPEKLRKQFDTLVDKVKKQQSEKRNAKPANQPKFENDSLDWAKDFLGESDGGGCGVGESTLRAVASDFPRLEAGIRSGREGIPGDQAPMDARFYGAGN